jgi:hypothetical protein
MRSQRGGLAGMVSVVVTPFQSTAILYACQGNGGSLGRSVSKEARSDAAQMVSRGTPSGVRRSAASGCLDALENEIAPVAQLILGNVTGAVEVDQRPEASHRFAERRREGA